jgi:PAS domain S-box-containing protein
MPETPASSNPPADTEISRLIIDSSVDFAIFTMAPEGITTSWNRGAEHLFGYAASDIIGMSADTIFIPEDRVAGVPERERQEASERGRATDERWHQRKDGSRFWASGLLMPLTRREDGFVKICRDLTRQHLAELSLKESEERFRVLATNIPQLVFLTRVMGDRTWPSPQWIDFTGLNLEQSLGFGWLDAIHPEDRAVTQAAWSEALQQGEYYVEHRVRRQRDGAYRWHQTRAKPLDPAAPTTVDWVGTMTDIDDLRRLQDRQQVMMSELQHRTRNVLAVVQAIARKTFRQTGTAETFMEEFEDRLAALSRIQSLLAQVERQVIQLRDLIEAELAAQSGEKIEAAKININGPSVALPALAAQTIGLAIHELATNAVKYGALAQSNGKLDIEWNIDEQGPVPRVKLNWIERNVRMPAEQPKRKGYGSELILRALPAQLDAPTELVFNLDGVSCTITVPLATLSQGVQFD